MGTGEEPPARRENGGRRRRWMDGEDDDEDEEYVAEEEEEEDDFAEELAASSAGEEGEDSDAEYQEDEEEEEEEETPRPKRPAKGGAHQRKGKKDPAVARAKRRRYEVDDDYEEESSEDEEPNEEDEIEEYEEETPRPVKGSARGQKGKRDPATAQARRRRYELDDDYEEPEEDEEDPDVDEEVEEYHEEIEEEEEAPPRPTSAVKCVRRGQNVELPRSHRRKNQEDDMDFEPELDEDEEVDEDIDFDPDVDDEDEDEFDDEEEEEFGAARARKVTIKNPAKRKSASKRQSLKKKKKKKKVNKGSKSSKRKTGSAKAKKSASVRRVRKRFVVDDSDEDSEDDDDDFIVDDQIEVDQHPRKKPRTGTSKRTELECPSVVDEETWPNVESETSEFEFVTSDDEPDDAGTAVVEASTVKKGRRKRKSGSESSSDSEFIVSDKELENLGETEPLKLPPVLPTPPRKNSITRHGEEKGKEKEEPEEAGKPICGICLSEEQKATVQGVLNCCSHYFCFACIMEWSMVESRCPLCKQRFTTITKSSKADLGLGLRKPIIKVEKRDQVYQPSEEEIRRWLDPYENVVCIECNQGGDDSLMLLCDICDSSAHTYCVGLGREVPEGNWYCGGCRLSDEGPSHARTAHTVGFERQSYRNHVNFSSVGFGVAAQNGTYDRSSSMNRRRSFQGIDLNLSPREVPGEIHPAESQALTDSVSTPSGRRATVSGRRQIHRMIRILLSQPRQPTRLQNMMPSFVPHNGAVPRTELNHRNFRSSSEANTSQIPDGIQNQHNGLPFAPSMPLDGDDFQHIEGVRSNLKNV